MRRALSILLVLASCGAPQDTACDAVCSELVTTCDYAAFPSFASCQQGCGYWESEGVDVQAYLECVRDADCDTFALVECEHAYGPAAH
jgi:hypothetical protein